LNSVHSGTDNVEHKIRLGEHGDMAAEDLKEAEGIRFLDISDAGEGKHVKTASSRHEFRFIQS
jgi:hypothetical protein